jgi:hypothetical protein
MNLFPRVVFLSILGLASTISVATPITYQFGGTIQSVFDTAAINPAISSGTEFSGTITWDADAVPTVSAPSQSIFQDSILGFDLSIGSLAFSYLPTTRFRTNDINILESAVYPALGDIVSINAASTLLSTDPTNPYFERAFNLNGIGSSLFSSVASIPSPFPSLDSFDRSPLALYLHYRQWDPTYSIQENHGIIFGVVTRMNAVNVPEPGSGFWLVAVAAVLLFAPRHRLAARSRQP